MLVREVDLLGTQGCHLCDEAEKVIHEFNEMMLPHDFMVNFSQLDVATSKNLVSTYGSRIPVIIDKVTFSELDWPFDLKTLYEFLRACS